MTVLVSRCELGAPDGRTVAIKDSIDIAGLPTRLGSKACDDAVPAAQHADVVGQLLAAGHHIIGKAVMHELAFGVTGINHHSGTPINPHYPQLIPGGSSSGSAAAVAEGLADYALGTDTGGSVRIPAACCGVFGFKPTFGRVSRRGVWPSSSSLDCVGPFAADLSMLQEAQEAIDPSFKPGPALAPTRFALLTHTGAEPAVEAALDTFLSPLSLIRVELPLLDKAFQAALAVINVETSAATAELLATGLIGTDVAARLARAGTVAAPEVEAAEKLRETFTAEVDHLLEQADVLVLPAMPRGPMSLQQAREGQMDLKMTALVRPFNLSGHPALVIPFEVNGNPIGIQLVGRKHEDEAVFAAAHALLEAGQTN
ncbi:amidase [Microbulbifer sp. TYP-18]|uniref:amidase n=1 Tax=Microbulbifer sp. TYP-18 TaxID=3230024 RepID=UPI0034C5F058